MSEPAKYTDDDDLASFGYRQRLDRTLGGFSSFAVGFSYLSILTGLPQLFYLGFGAGGPAFFWTWPMVFFGQFLVALCFAEMAARYPLSGGVYQWSRQIGPPWVGWMAGWVYLACAVITLASVALALQSTLPQLWPGFQLVGRADVPEDSARNAVWLGCLLLIASTLINSVGVRLLSYINNLGVMAEMVGALTLIAVFFGSARRGPIVVLETLGRGDGQPMGYMGAFTAAALTATFVLYGFDTAGSLAEETSNPRKNAPRAILGALASVGIAGALLILGTLLAAEDVSDPALGQISGGMPSVINAVLGSRLGPVLLAVVGMAVIVCTLTVHAAAVRLVFAMARDNNLPGSKYLAEVPETTRTPVLPAVVLGIAAIALLLVNLDHPRVIEVMASVAIVWANLAYLFVTVPLLCRRVKTKVRGEEETVDGLFTLGRHGMLVNLAAVAWGAAVVINVGWPRPEIYGEPWYRLLSAPLATGGMLAVGGFFWFLRRNQAGILASHQATPALAGFKEEAMGDG